MARRVSGLGASFVVVVATSACSASTQPSQANCDNASFVPNNGCNPPGWRVPDASSPDVADALDTLGMDEAEVATDSVTETDVAADSLGESSD